MIDTIRFEIKGIAAKDMEIAKQSLHTTMTVDNSTGDVLSEITRTSLLGSWDSRISIMVRDYVYDFITETQTINVGHLSVVSVEKKKIPVRVSCPEYFVLEFSLAKWANGVNFLNDTLSQDALYLSCFRRWLQVKLGIALPSLDFWQITRVDMALNFELGSHKAVKDYVSAWRNLDYPRRQKPHFYEDSLFIPGSTTTIKLYYKYPEFKKHDEGRLSRFVINSGVDKDKGKSIASMIRELTLGLMRYEVEFHKRKLKALEIENIHDLFSHDWSAIMKKELYRIIDGAETTKTYRYQEVINILQDTDLTGKGITSEAAAAIWSTIVMKGRKYAQKKFTYKKVYRARVVFKELGINTLGHLSDKEVDKKTGTADIFQFEKSNGTLKKLQYFDLFEVDKMAVNF